MIHNIGLEKSYSLHGSAYQTTILGYSLATKSPKISGASNKFIKECRMTNLSLDVISRKQICKTIRY